MCGISGSSLSIQAFKLYQSNLDRGYYSSSVTTIQCPGPDLLYRKNLTGIDTTKQLGLFSSILPEKPNTVYSLYHSRGPTVETTNWIPDNNHPFLYGNWIVAHNGVISNFKQLCETEFPNIDFTGKTDSVIIPMLIHKATEDQFLIDGLKYTLNTLESEKIIASALEKLKGTFALWIYSVFSQRLFITRSASTLFGNITTGDFCSTRFEGSEPLKEGVIYELDQDFSHLIELKTYRVDSPYFID